MSNGDDEPDEPVAALETRLESVEDSLEAAETEADLDDVEETLDAVEADLEAADLPEPDEDDEEAADPRADIESRLEDFREDLAQQRGPYVEDVVAVLEDAGETVESSEWTEDGTPEVVDAGVEFFEATEEFVTLEATAGDDPEALADALSTAAETLAETDLDPDEDAETIEGALAVAETLASDLEDAETWADLTVQERLAANGFYDVLTNENRKDFPPEWNAVKLHAARGDVEPILEALDRLESDFTEEHIYEQLRHLGSAAEPAFDALHQRAQRRDKGAIRILGKIANPAATDTLHDFIDGDGDPSLQKVVLRALGEIGSADSTQPVADRLAADDPEVRSVAARALGLLGDTRAVEPLREVLAEDDAASVRASAAWALRQVGTERAREVASEYADDPDYLVQVEAERAAPS